MNLICIGCNKTPSEIDEYIEAAAEYVPPITADEYVMREEGTLNLSNGHFLCTDCYITAGMPSSEQGWVAP